MIERSKDWRIQRFEDPRIRDARIRDARIRDSGSAISDEGFVGALFALSPMG